MKWRCLRLLSKKSKILFWMILMMLLSTTLIVRITAQATLPTMKAPDVSDPSLLPGSSFYIDITVDDAVNLWGYGVLLSFDPDVLTATSYTSYDPFTDEWPSEIGYDYVVINYAMLLGEKTGVTGSAPLARIDFTVNMNGTCLLDLHHTTLIDVDGLSVKHKLVDGHFSNVEGKASISPQMNTGDVGETFSINITAAKVEHLWGHRFVLGYNATVLNATSFVSYSPFTEEWASEINNTAGYVAVNYSMPIGEPEGFSTVDPTPIANIGFLVKATGSSPLAFLESVFIDVYNATIDHEPVDGFFSNNHDIAITHVLAFPTLISRGEATSVNVTLVNRGDFDEVFNVTATYNGYILGTQTCSLEAGAETIVSIPWKTKDLAEGNYIIRAEAILPSDVHPSDNTFPSTSTVTVRGGALGPVTLLYALAIGVVAFFGAFSGIYRWRWRKRRM